MSLKTHIPSLATNTCQLFSLKWQAQRLLKLEKTFVKYSNLNYHSLSVVLLVRKGGWEPERAFPWKEVASSSCNSNNGRITFSQDNPHTSVCRGDLCAVLKGWDSIKLIFSLPNQGHSYKNYPPLLSVSAVSKDWWLLGPLGATVWFYADKAAALPTIASAASVQIST